MSHNTTSLNKQRQPLNHLDSVWLFGYGSLIYKADFAYLRHYIGRLTPATAVKTKLKAWCI